MTNTNNSWNSPYISSNGQILIGSSGNNPVASTLTSGSGISIINGPGVITISSEGNNLQFVEDDNTTAAAANNILYLKGSSAQGLVTTGSGNTVTFANLNWTTIQKGVGRLATGQEVQDGTVTNAAITPSSIFYLFNASRFVADDQTTATPNNGVLNLLGSAAQGLVTTGRGNTVTFSNLNWSTVQKGVGRLATDAEAISGTVQPVAIIPSSLSAKLGAQTTNALPVSAGSTLPLSWLGPLTDGQLLIGRTGNVPLAANLTAGTGVSITNNSGSITISADNAIITTDYTNSYASSGGASSTISMRLIGPNIDFIHSVFSATISPGSATASILHNDTLISADRPLSNFSIIVPATVNGGSDQLRFNVDNDGTMRLFRLSPPGLWYNGDTVVLPSVRGMYSPINIYEEVLFRPVTSIAGIQRGSTTCIHLQSATATLAPAFQLRAGTNRAVFMGVCGDDSSPIPATITQVTFGGVRMRNAPHMNVQLWGAPASINNSLWTFWMTEVDIAGMANNTSYTVTLTGSSLPAANNICFIWVIYDSVSQTKTFNRVYTSSTTANILGINNEGSVDAHAFVFAGSDSPPPAHMTVSNYWTEIALSAHSSGQMILADRLYESAVGFTVTENNGLAAVSIGLNRAFL